MRRFALCSSLVLACATATQAQSVLNLSGQYRVGSIGASFSRPPCASSSTPSIEASDTTVTFQPGNSFSLNRFILSVCSGGTTTTNNVSTAGPYTVNNQGLLTLDLNPGMPGEDLASLYLSPDATVAFEGRLSTEDQNYVSVAVKLSTGKNNGTLNGNYFFVRMEMANSVSNYSQKVERGTIAFNGAGSYTETGSRHSTVFGQSSSTTNYQANGSYNVTFNGSISMPNHDGAVSPDGELFYWVRRDAAAGEANLTIGVRQGGSYTQNLANGDWGFVQYDNEVASGAFLETDFGKVTMSPESPAGGTVDGSVFHVSTEPASSFAAFELFSDTYTLLGDGNLSVGTDLAGGMGSKGTFFVAGYTSNDGGGILLGNLRCPWPTPFGLATPGSGAISPRLTPTGGFSYLGNSGYGIRVENAVGGSAGVLMFSGGVSAGIPFLGGTIWLDPSLLLSFPIAINGPSGVPGMGTGSLAVPLPANPMFEGQQLTAQGFIADAGAPGGLAMTSALVLDFCRQ